MLVGDRGVRGPLAQLAGDRAEFVIRAPGGRRHDQPGVFHNHRHPGGALGLELGDVGAEPQIVGENVDRLARVFRQHRFLAGGPLGEAVAAFFHADAVSEIVADHHVEAGEQPLAQKFVEGGDAGFAIRRRQQDAVADVAVEDELDAGTGLVKIDDFPRPRG